MSVNGTQVLIIGGGPGGAAVGNLVAAAGLQATILEREPFPRFHIGESLIPETYWSFEKLGVLDKLKASAFPEKYSVQFISENGKESRPFYFFERDPHESSMTWQVDRAEFDALLLDAAAERGADVRMGWRVRKILFDGDCARGVVGEDANGRPFELTADVVVDATGLDSLAARQRGWVRPDPKLIKAAVYAHYENGRRDSGKDEGATLIIHTRGNRGWFWYIPLSRNRVSVGVVGATAELLKGRGAIENVLDEEIAACPAMASRLSEATRVSDVRATSDFSWRSSRASAERLLLIGDAFGFLDPIYSSGVFLALKSGELAAETLINAFAENDFSAEFLGGYGESLATGMEYFRKLIYAFYTPGFSFANFVSQNPERREQLIRILIGDVFSGGLDSLFEGMAEVCELPDHEPLHGDVAPK